MVRTYNNKITKYPCFCVPPIQWVPVDLSPELKRPGSEADHSPPTGAQAKKTWTYTSTPPYVFMALCLVVKHRDKFTFYLEGTKPIILKPQP
jgi:hypothetical protein